MTHSGCRAHSAVEPSQVNNATYLLDTPSDGLSSVMTRRVIQWQQTHSLPLHILDGAFSSALGNTQGTEPTAGVLCDLLSTNLSDFTGIPGLLDNNLQQTSHIRVLQTTNKSIT